MSDNRPIAYQEDKISIYRASGTGSCLTALVAAKAGHEPAPSEYSQKILTDAAREGNLHEGSVVHTLKSEHGWRIRGSQDLMEMKIIPKVFIRGHVDGFAKPKGARNERVLEVKTMSKNRFEKWIRSGKDARERLLSDEFISYAWQISNYMLHYGMGAMYVVKNRDSGKLDISEIKLPPIDLKTIRKKIIQVEMWSKKGEIPPCEASSGDQFFCAFPYLHNGDDKPFGDEPAHEDDPIDDATTALLSSMAEHYNDLKKQVKMLTPLDEERKDVGKKLVEAMGGIKGPKKVVAGDWQVTRRDGSSSYISNANVAFDLGISIEEYEEILAKNKTKSTYSYPIVKYVGDE